MGYKVILMPTPSQGFKSEAEVLEWWKSGRDMKIVGGPHCTIEDLGNLKQCYDYIQINAILFIDEEMSTCSINVHTSILAGITTYI